MKRRRWLTRGRDLDLVKTKKILKRKRRTRLRRSKWMKMVKVSTLESFKRETISVLERNNSSVL